jgi:hypothetical protein
MSKGHVQHTHRDKKYSYMVQIWEMIAYEKANTDSGVNLRMLNFQI